MGGSRDTGRRASDSMRMSRSAVCLSLVVGWVGWGSAGAATSRAWDGFPPEGTPFLLVHAGYSVCLTALADGRSEGQPCEWETPAAAQRWRHERGQLINEASGACLLAPGLVPCEEASRFDVAYDLLEERLTLGQVLPPRAVECFLVREEWRAEAPTPRYPLGFAPLGPGGCGGAPAQSRWVIIPVHS